MSETPEKTQAIATIEATSLTLTEARDEITSLRHMIIENLRGIRDVDLPISTSGAVALSIFFGVVFDRVYKEFQLPLLLLPLCKWFILMACFIYGRRSEITKIREKIKALQAAHPELAEDRDSPNGTTKALPQAEKA